MDLTVWWAPALAFAAGLVSFASPCVLPLVPGYVAFVSGQRPGSEAPALSGFAPMAVAERTERRAAVPMLLFVAGFAVVFTALGAFTRTFAPILRSPWGIRISGLIVLGFGVFMVLYSLRAGGAWLFAERRPFLSKVRPGIAGAFPLGMAFATGFTPCIGPVLAGILTIAAAQGGGLWGALLMFAYSLGLGLPFVLVGLGLRRLMGALSWVKRNYHWIAGVGGVLMIGIGLLLVLNLWTRFLAWSGLLDLVSGFEPPI